jgi:hypothetical protein
MAFLGGQLFVMDRTKNAVGNSYGFFAREAHHSYRPRTGGGGKRYYSVLLDHRCKGKVLCFRLYALGFML